MLDNTTIECSTIIEKRSKYKKVYISSINWLDKKWWLVSSGDDIIALVKYNKLWSAKHKAYEYAKALLPLRDRQYQYLIDRAIVTVHEPSEKYVEPRCSCCGQTLPKGYRSK